ncbi:hypothetical protein F511_42890 [Dorcoceras hygrometricum]|uniref:Uncharacterized protein n=1 Tax=Dorcoceras hygrometricum TaxID=472368 RepID=A0A2Z7BT22_9LAMI|nr:hypothetical protein F511_42890 [Dorcoceras hygrometricum]
MESLSFAKADVRNFLELCLHQLGESQRLAMISAVSILRASPKFTFDYPLLDSIATIFIDSDAAKALSTSSLAKLEDFHSKRHRVEEIDRSEGLRGQTMGVPYHDRKMKTSSNKRFSRKHDRKVLVAEESTKSWADSDSDSSSSSSSSSESEQEEVHCFMADQTDEDEVFDFSNVEFTRDDLVIALNDMVKEYRKLSHSFEEAKAENMSLKSSSAESSSDELEDVDILKTELSKLQAENEMLKDETSELKEEIFVLKQVVSAWNNSARKLHKLQ